LLAAIDKSALIVTNCKLLEKQTIQKMAPASSVFFRTTKTVLSAAKTTALATMGGTLGYGAYQYQTDEGSRRAVQAYSAFVPVVVHYRWLEAQATYLGDYVSITDENYRVLDEKYAVPTVRKLGELQGMYCKYGQTAAGFTNTLGDAWIVELRKLENKVPPRSFGCIKETIETETGLKLEEIFEFVDPVPLGSASIGQVHEAVLRKQDEHGKTTPHRVAVKVQYPEAQVLFKGDMRTIRRMCEYLAPEQLVMLTAIEKQNATELDYTHEEANLRTIHKNMKKHGFLPQQVVVPKPIPLPVAPSKPPSTRVLVMELVPGQKLIDGIHDYWRVWAKNHGTTLEQLEQEAREKIEKEGIPNKYDGPSASKLVWYQRWLKAKDALGNLPIALYNTGVRKLVGGEAIPYQHSILPPNIPRIVDSLMRVHGYQLFSDGFFNADPHGGNFMLLPDGRIGLIDLGSTKKLTKNERLSACLLYAAIARKDEKMLFDLCEIGGYKSKHGDKEVLMKLILFGYDSWGKDLMGNANIQTFMDELKKKDPWEEVPDNLIMAQFMSIRLRSLALGMNHPVRCSEYWAPIAEEILEKEGHPYESWDYQKMVQYMPKMSIQKSDPLSPIEKFVEGFKGMFHNNRNRKEAQ
jgi:aarF domain-containing kinase